MVIKTSISDYISDGVKDNSSYNRQNNNERYEHTTAIAYLQEFIENPWTTIVQNQIDGNTVKMLIVIKNDEQRLITFDIPNEPCTVQDLLEQVHAHISSFKKTRVSLVSDRVLGINYIIDDVMYVGGVDVEEIEGPQR